MYLKSSTLRKDGETISNLLFSCGKRHISHRMHFILFTTGVKSIGYSVYDSALTFVVMQSLLASVCFWRKRNLI